MGMGWCLIGKRSGGSQNQGQEVLRHDGRGHIRAVPQDDVGAALQVHGDGVVDIEIGRSVEARRADVMDVEMVDTIMMTIVEIGTMAMAEGIENVYMIE